MSDDIFRTEQRKEVFLKVCGHGVGRRQFGAFLAKSLVENVKRRLLVGLSGVVKVTATT